MSHDCFSRHNVPAGRSLCSQYGLYVVWLLVGKLLSWTRNSYVHRLCCLNWYRQFTATVMISGSRFLSAEARSLPVSFQIRSSGQHLNQPLLQQIAVVNMWLVERVFRQSVDIDVGRQPTPYCPIDDNPMCFLSLGHIDRPNCYYFESVVKRGYYLAMKDRDIVSKKTDASDSDILFETITVPGQDGGRLWLLRA